MFEKHLDWRDLKNCHVFSQSCWGPSNFILCWITREDALHYCWRKAGAIRVWRFVRRMGRNVDQLELGKTTTTSKWNGQNKSFKKNAQFWVCHAKDNGQHLAMCSTPQKLKIEQPPKVHQEMLEDKLAQLFWGKRPHCPLLSTKNIKCCQIALHGRWTTYPLVWYTNLISRVLPQTVRRSTTLLAT